MPSLSRAQAGALTVFHRPLGESGGRRHVAHLALGGVRLSEIEVPTAENVGESVSGGACPRWGYHKPFSLETLNALYPNRGQYISKVIKVTNDNVKSGYLLEEDAEVTIGTAKRTSVGGP